MTVQAIGQWAENDQDASSDASSEQFYPSNSNYPVRLFSWGGGGSVEQSNDSFAASAAGNRNDTCQRASQDSHGSRKCGKKEHQPAHGRRME